MITAKIRNDKISADILYKGDIVGTAYLIEKWWDQLSIWDDEWMGGRLSYWCNSLSLPVSTTQRLILEAICAEAYDNGELSQEEWVEQAKNYTRVFSLGDYIIAINPEKNPYMHLWAWHNYPDKQFSVIVTGCYARFMTMGSVFDKQKIACLENVEYTYFSGDYIVAKIMERYPGKVKEKTVLEVITASMTWRIWGWPWRLPAYKKQTKRKL